MRTTDRPDSRWTWICRARSTGDGVRTAGAAAGVETAGVPSIDGKIMDSAPAGTAGREAVTGATASDAAVAPSVAHGGGAVEARALAWGGGGAQEDAGRGVGIQETPPGRPGQGWQAGGWGRRKGTGPPAGSGHPAPRPGNWEVLFPHWNGV